MSRVVLCVKTNSNTFIHYYNLPFTKLVSCFTADFHVLIFLDEQFRFMFFHGVNNHLIFYWYYFYTYFALTCTIFSYVDKFFKQLRNVNLGNFFSFLLSCHSCCHNASIFFLGPHFCRHKCVSLTSSSSILLVSLLLSSVHCLKMQGQHQTSL